MTFRMWQSFILFLLTKSKLNPFLILSSWSAHNVTTSWKSYATATLNKGWDSQGEIGKRISQKIIWIFARVVFFGYIFEEKSYKSWAILEILHSAGFKRSLRSKCSKAHDQGRQTYFQVH